MGWRGAGLMLVAAVFAAVLGLLAARAWQGGSASPSGPPVAAFTLPDRHGRPMTLPPPGRAVLINYWASWCEPCRMEMPLLDAYSRGKTADRPQVVGIALDDLASAEAFLAQSPVSFRILIEPPQVSDSSVALGDTEGLLPFSVLIGADGRVLARRAGRFASVAELEHWVADAR